MSQAYSDLIRVREYGIPVSMKHYENPRAKVKDWRDKLKKVQKLHAKGKSIQLACSEVGIAISTFHVWKKRREG